MMLDRKTIKTKKLIKRYYKKLTVKNKNNYLKIKTNLLLWIIKKYKSFKIITRKKI